MKFSLHTFSKRFPPVECAVFVVHEPPITQGMGPYRHVGEARNHYRGTAAAIILPDGRYWIGVCLCSPSDQFIKAVGRAKAIGRAYSQIRWIKPGFYQDKLPHGITEYGLEKLKEQLFAAIDEMKRERGIL